MVMKMDSLTRMRCGMQPLQLATVLIGMPGTGKSTWLSNLEYPYDDKYIVSTDNLVQKIAKENNDEGTYDEIWPKYIKEAEKRFWEDMLYTIQRRRAIVVDRTNLTQKGRARIIEMFKKARMFDEYDITAYVFGMELPIHEWLNRLAGRSGKTIPQHVLMSMAKSFVYPTLEEGFSSVCHINQ